MVSYQNMERSIAGIIGTFRQYFDQFKPFLHFSSTMDVYMAERLRNRTALKVW